MCVPVVYYLTPRNLSAHRNTELYNKLFATGRKVPFVWCRFKQELLEFESVYGLFSILGSVRTSQEKTALVFRISRAWIIAQQPKRTAAFFSEDQPKTGIVARVGPSIRFLGGFFSFSFLCSIPLDLFRLFRGTRVVIQFEIKGFFYFLSRGRIVPALFVYFHLDHRTTLR